MIERNLHWSPASIGFTKYIFRFIDTYSARGIARFDKLKHKIVPLGAAFFCRWFPGIFVSDPVGSTVSTWLPDEVRQSSGSIYRDESTSRVPVFVC